jgi:hypothetical protein
MSLEFLPTSPTLTRILWTAPEMRVFHRLETIPPRIRVKWDRWKDPSGQWIRSCSILTTTPNVVTSTVHDRMPVILDPDSYDLWLDPGMTNVEAVSEMLKPYDARQMRCYPVSTRINHVVNDDEECSRPVELAETQKRLFA